MGRKYQPKTKLGKKNKRRHGITPAQSSYLAALKRDLDEPFNGNGKSKQWASDEIDRCLLKLGRSPKPDPRKQTPQDVQRDERRLRALERLDRDMDHAMQKDRSEPQGTIQP